MFVLVDSNENTDRAGNGNDSNVRATERLKKMFPNLEIAPLTCGDINIILDNGQTIAIERKRAGDFLGSIGTQRIFRQVENMANNSAWSCVILEGGIQFDHDDMAVIPKFNRKDIMVGSEVTKWRGVSVRGAMLAILWSGCPIIVTDPLRLPQTVMEIISFCSKPAEHAQGLGRKRIVTFPPITLAEEIVSSLPGVGLKRARSLLEFARGQNAMDTAVLGEALSWVTVFPMIERSARPEGWGDKTIENVRNALGIQMGEYLTIQEDKKQVEERKYQERKQQEQQFKERSKNGKSRK